MPAPELPVSPERQPDIVFDCGCRMSDTRDAITCDEHSGDDEENEA